MGVNPLTRHVICTTYTPGHEHDARGAGGPDPMTAVVPGAWREASSAGQTFRFIDSGEGPLVVLLHGFPDVPDSWDAIRQRLNAEGYRTVVPYLRGYHPATFSKRSFKTRDLAEDHVLLLDALGESSAVVVGHDWGASVAYGAATMYPQRVTKLVAIGIPHPLTLRPKPKEAPYGRHFLYFKLPWASLTAKAFDLKLVDRLYRRWSPHWDGPARDEAVAESVQALRDKRVLRNALAYYKALNPFDRSLRPKIAVPGLVVGGSDDPPVVQRAYAATPSRFGGPCEVRVLDGAGHWPHREREAEFLDVLLAFLAR
ncbi:MAG TPA: alpha/beta hydrolase [Aeromicrobium sp.]|nr:alpha/beta hydrolase [Aeromicrobium sp.]